MGPPESARRERRPGRTWREPTAPARTRQVPSRLLGGRRRLASSGFPLKAGPASFVSTASTRSRVPAAIAAALVRRAPGHVGLPEDQTAPAGLSPPQGFRRASPSRGPAAGPACAQARWRLLAGWRLRTRAPRASPGEEPEGGDAGVRAWDGWCRLIRGGRPAPASLRSASHFPTPLRGQSIWGLTTFLPRLLCRDALICLALLHLSVLVLVWVCSGDPYGRLQIDSGSALRPRAT